MLDLEYAIQSWWN